MGTLTVLLTVLALLIGGQVLFLLALRGALLLILLVPMIPAGTGTVAGPIGVAGRAGGPLHGRWV